MSPDYGLWSRPTCTATRKESPVGCSYDRIVLFLNSLELLLDPSVSGTVIHGSAASELLPVYVYTLQIYFLNAGRSGGPRSLASGTLVPGQLT